MNEATAMSADPTELTLADTCILAVWEMKRIATTRRASNSTQDRVRQEENDKSITVNRHLFQKGPVRALLQRMDEAYAAHCDMTAPWIDKGPRILPGARIQHYIDTMNGHKWAIEAMAAPIIADWDLHVYNDICERRGAGQSNVDTKQYPTQAQAERRFSCEWRLDPIPTKDDFRTQVPEYVKQKRQDYLKAAEEGIRVDLLKRVLEPIQNAVERLSVPIGDKGSVFRDSLVGNMQHALDTVRELNVGNDPDVADILVGLESVLRVGITPESLRTQQGARYETAQKLAAIAQQFQALV